LAEEVTIWLYRMSSRCPREAFDSGVARRLKTFSLQPKYLVTFKSVRMG
jgi:hypothetical protein